MSSQANETSDASLQQIIDDLRARLADAEEILQAIALHKVDAFVVSKADIEQVYTLRGADHAYQVILETMNEGAATIGADSIIYYCNPAFSALLQRPVEQLLGTSLIQFVHAEDLPLYTALIEQGLAERSRGEVMLWNAGGRAVPVLLSCSSLKLDDLQSLCLVATDLTEQKRQAEIVAAEQFARDALEQRVHERTAELIKTNLRLEREIEERKQAEIALTEVRQRLSQSQETERLLLARELHDGPLQEVIGMAFDLLLLAQTLEDQEQVAKVTAISEAVQKTARHLRLMAQTLRPPVLAHLGLAAAVRAHIKQIQDIKEKPVLTLVCSEENWSMPEETSLALLRIVQQAIQNALQHADAERIEIRLSFDETWLHLEIEDDGRGFTKPYNRVKFARDGHLGVVGMAERAEAIRGQFDVLSKPGQGTCIRITLPRSVQQQETT
ncbi:MAG: PAS domain S-box protein [Caldilineaceae bacterium]|nr:PAS domain S-box protein [Caldilineaceae bacterium]